MAFNPNTETLRKAATKQKIIEAGFHAFAERTIDAVNLTEVAKYGGLGIGTVYNYYSSKEPLIMDISAWIWEQYTAQNSSKLEWQGRTAAEVFEFYLDSFIDLYRNHRDILRFNQFFNVYVQRESISSEHMHPFLGVVDALAERFHACYEMARVDGTLRTEVPEREMFSTSLHLMLAVVTRYAVGLVYNSGIDPEKEVLFEKELLMRAYTIECGEPPEAPGTVPPKPASEVLPGFYKSASACDSRL